MARDGTLSTGFDDIIDALETELQAKGVSDAQFDSSTGVLGLVGRMSDIAPAVGGIYPTVSIDISKTPSTVYVHDSVLLSAKVNADYDDSSQVDVDLKGVLQGATVTFKNGNTVVGTAVTGLDGIATYTMTNLAVGNYSITAHFDGSNTDYESATSSALTFSVGHNYSLAFSQASYTARGGSCTVECTLLDNGVAVSGETITLSDGSSTYSSITNSSGVATWNLTNLLQGGTFTATYSTVSNTCTISGTFAPQLIITYDASVNQTFQTYNATPFTFTGDLLIDYGDGTTETISANKQLTHTYSDTNIHTIKIIGNITEIGTQALYRITGGKTIDIPSSVITLKQFSLGLSGWESIIIPSSVTELQNYCIYQCKNLTSLSIPSSVTTIGSSVIGECTNLTDIQLYWESNPLAYSKVQRNTAIYTIPYGTTSVYVNAGYPSDKLVERSA